jgi:hypothetical protein
VKDDVLMTVRVSRDSGRTWGPTMAVRGSDPAADFNALHYPPCQCPQCMPERKAERQAVKRP